MMNLPKLNYLTIDKILLEALREDIPIEDISTNAIISEESIGQVSLYAKEDGIIAGLNIFERIFKLLDFNTNITYYYKDGDKITKGKEIALIEGKVRTLLTGERVALNYLQRLSGIASYTRKMVESLNNKSIKIVDTRKTTPNMRILEKYATKVGGGYNHRNNLSDGILLKDNHIAAAGSIKNAVEKAKKYSSFINKIELEVENLEMVKEALEAKADIIMLDNMSIDNIERAVKLINNQAEIECSGNITLENIKDYSNLEIDYISTGAPTHSSKALDLSMKDLRVLK
ncbi:MAG: carboxylating nicotinate-nucleotide diphosphorylase [Miniphocaeibacter sp.]|uniref:carboxylating nicotinate-nucleotide diphosphorylase n=1 Tax=Miniphocaeibacter sp. TaxID=3100973 RepID=UPI003BAE5F8A